MVSLRRADEYPKRVLLSIYNQKKAKLEEQETENGCTQKKKKKKKIMMPVQFLEQSRFSNTESVE